MAAAFVEVGREPAARQTVRGCRAVARGASTVATLAHAARLILEEPVDAAGQALATRPTKAVATQPVWCRRALLGEGDARGAIVSARAHAVTAAAVTRLASAEAAHKPARRAASNANALVEDRLAVARSALGWPGARASGTRRVTRFALMLSRIEVLGAAEAHTRAVVTHQAAVGARGALAGERPIAARAAVVAAGARPVRVRVLRWRAFAHAHAASKWHVALLSGRSRNTSVNHLFIIHVLLWEHRPNTTSTS